MNKVTIYCEVFQGIILRSKAGRAADQVLNDNNREVAMRSITLLPIHRRIICLGVRCTEALELNNKAAFQSQGGAIPL